MNTRKGKVFTFDSIVPSLGIAHDSQYFFSSGFSRAYQSTNHSYNLSSASLPTPGYRSRYGATLLNTDVYPLIRFECGDQSRKDCCQFRLRGISVRRIVFIAEVIDHNVSTWLSHLVTFDLTSRATNMQKATGNECFRALDRASCFCEETSIASCRGCGACSSGTAL